MSPGYHKQQHGVTYLNFTLLVISPLLSPLSRELHFDFMALLYTFLKCYLYERVQDVERKTDERKKKRNNFYLHILGNTNPLNRDDGFPSIRVLTPAATFTIELRGYWREKEQSKSKRYFYTFSEL